MAKKLTLTIGPIGIEFEGEELPGLDDLREIADVVADVYKRNGLDYNGTANSSGKLRIQGSTASIASRLNCVSGPELIVAAAARITFVDGEEWFDADQLLREMRQAAAHFEESYRPDLPSDVESLVHAGKLVEVAPKLYALSATMRRELQRALAE